MGLVNRVALNNKRYYVSDIRLQSEMDQFLYDYGYHCIYVRLDRRIKCTACWNETTHEPDRQCTRCLGTGYKILQIERHLVRDVDAPSRKGIWEISLQEPGMVVNPKYVIYFMSTARPVLGDVIYLPLFDDKTGEIIRLKMRFEIDHPREKVEDMGMTSHWEVDCRASTADLKDYEKMLRKKPYVAIN